MSDPAAQLVDEDNNDRPARAFRSRRISSVVRAPESERKLRVLIIAELANPEWQSVPLVGWHCARSLMDAVDGHLVTNAVNRDALIRAGLIEGVDFSAIDVTASDRLVWAIASRLTGGDNKGLTTWMALSLVKYLHFEYLTWRRFGGRLRAGEFRIVHRVTPVSPTIPSLLARRVSRLGIPFVIGPLNGGLPWPRQFGAVRRKEREWLSYVRRLHRLVPGYRSTRRNAAAILVGSKAVLDEMPRSVAARCVYVPENGLDHRRFPVVRIPNTSSRIEAIFVGRLVPYKGADMAIEAAAELMSAGRLALRIVGDGPERPGLERLSKRLGLAHAVTFEGNVPTAELSRYLIRSDLLLFPSIREFGGAVVVEAMAMGVVPVVVDYGGPGEHVVLGTGFSIPLGSRREIVTRLRSLLTDICRSPEQLRPLAIGAHVRAWEHYRFDVKAKQMHEVYRWVLGARDKPDFGLPLGVSAGATPV